MNFTCLSPHEVRTMYKQAKNQEQMIGTLAELTDSTKTQMREFLGVAKKKRTPPAKLDKEKAMELYQQMYTDREIANKLGAAKTTVSEWRKRNGLPSNSDPAIKEQQKQRKHEQRLALYMQGKIDKEIAEEVGTVISVIHRWRKANNLPPHGTQGGAR